MKRESNHLRRRIVAGSLAVAAVVLGSCVASPVSRQGWARYTVVTGAHAALVDPNGIDPPLAGPTTVAGRTYRFLFDASARYVLTAPAQPDDRFDWNKLPGFSDCGDLDLSSNGAMFGWRWRDDTTPRRLELVPYANNDGIHLHPDHPLLTLDSSDLDSEPNLRYEVRIHGDLDRYVFRIVGTVGDRPVDVGATLPRACPAVAPNVTKWASGFYFGGTSTAPQTITGWIRES